jgi:hypothetical protein
MNENTPACQYLLGAFRVLLCTKVSLSDTVHSNNRAYGKS